MFPLWYCSICQSCEEQLSLDFPPVTLPTFIGTIRASDYLHIIFSASLRCWRIPAGHTFLAGTCRFSPVDKSSLYGMADFKRRKVIPKLTKSLVNVLLSTIMTMSAPWNLSISTLKCLVTLPPDCLRFTCFVASQAQDSLTVFWLGTFCAGFPPAKWLTLSWAHHSNDCSDNKILFQHHGSIRGISGGYTTAGTYSWQYQFRFR